MARHAGHVAALTDFWYTRGFYELGSGRAPFVTHSDYDPSLPKHMQKYRKHRPTGITLGDICDAVSELFDAYSAARFVMVESIHVQRDVGNLEDDRPVTKSYMPGSSAEKAHGWHRLL